MKIATSLLVSLSQAKSITNVKNEAEHCRSLKCADGFVCESALSATALECIAESECNEKGDHHIFNHFYDNDGELELVAECRPKWAEPMPGFTCGTDPSLMTGTNVYIPKRAVQKQMDTRRESILRTDDNQTLLRLLNKHTNCPIAAATAGEEQCNPINLFDQSDCVGQDFGDLVHFKDAFNFGTGCLPTVETIHDETSWYEKNTIYVGYDDLVAETPFGTIFRAMGKTYEISCNIEKMGDVGTDVKTETERDDDTAEATTGTSFEMKTFFNDEPYNMEERTIQIRPDMPADSRFRFEISSNNDKEYVHLEHCELSLTKSSDAAHIDTVSFIENGCVSPASAMDLFFEMNDQVSQVGRGLNSDGFFMKPLSFGCSSEWKIDCLVTTCSPVLRFTNPEAYHQYCMAGDFCPTRYSNLLAHFESIIAGYISGSDSNTGSEYVSATGSGIVSGYHDADYYDTTEHNDTQDTTNHEYTTYTEYTTETHNTVHTTEFGGSWEHSIDGLDSFVDDHNQINDHIDDFMDAFGSLNVGQHTNRHGRKRRAVEPVEQVEAHVETTMLHPCFWVNKHSPEYCITKDPKSCWTIPTCKKTFTDFNPSKVNMPPVKPVKPTETSVETADNDEDVYGLKEFMDQIHEQIKLKIDEVVATQSPNYIERLREAAAEVQTQRKSVDEAISQLIQLISESY